MYGLIAPGDDRIAWQEGVPSLETMQEFVGGWVDSLDIATADLRGHRRITLWLHDEGRIIPLAPSIFLPELAALASANGMTPNVATSHATIHGPVVVTVTDTMSGETLGLSEPERNALTFGRMATISFTHGLMIPHLEWAPQDPYLRAVQRAQKASRDGDQEEFDAWASEALRLENEEA